MANDLHEPRQLDLNGGTILYDAALLAEPQNAFFEPSYWRDQGSLVPAPAGRGSAFFFEYQDVAYVLRHYCRGGLVRHVCKDSYVWAGLEGSRAWLEWHLLARLKQMDLPVPTPWAARVQRRGLLYRADIIVERFADVLTLSAAAKEVLPAERWRAVGACIRRFHDAGVYHADLNAHNILLAADGPIYLIDFDRGEIGLSGTRWYLGNLKRLHRSLKKLSANGAMNGFNAAAWEALILGYGRVPKN